MHYHEHHSDDHHHDHEHLHDHDHTHDGENHHNGGHSGGNHHGGSGDGHDNLLRSKDEAAAFLQYTLHHNAHHEEELDSLAHSLEHLQLTKEADEIRLCINELDHANRHLEAVLAALK